MPEAPYRYQAVQTATASNTDTNQAAPSFDHWPNYSSASLLAEIRDVLDLLNQRLRPLSGHVNVHPLGGDTLAVASYNLTAGADPIQIVGNLPHGTLAQVTISANASCHVTTARDTTLTGAFRIPANNPVTFPVSTDLWLFTDTGTPFVSVAIVSYDLAA